MTGTAMLKRMLSPAQIEVGLLEIADIAKRANVRVILIGGVALQAYGCDRFTVHLDVAAEGRLPELAEESPLSFGGYQSHTPSGVPVDVILRNDAFARVYREALKHPRHFPDLPLGVVSPEFLTLMKMVARRTKDDSDLETLLGLGIVDEPKAVRLATRLLGAYAADDLRALIDVAAWKRSRGNPG